MSAFNNLIGLEYLPGKQDCFSIGRRYFRQNFDLRLRNYARPDRFWEDPHLDLYRFYQREGFKAVIDDTITIGDVLLMPLHTPFATHACIVVDDNLILHHPPGGLSCTDRMRPRWSNRATVVLRHPLVTQLLKPVPKTVHLHEVLDADVFRNPEFQRAAARVLGSSR
mgnify:FL=1